MKVQEALKNEAFKCLHDGEKVTGWDEVTCCKCGWIVPSGERIGIHNGWFPSHEAHKEYKKFRTYTGMNEVYPIDSTKSALSEIENSEPAAYMYQHEETGNIGFIDQWQVDNGFEKNNPRLKIITSLYTSPQHIEKCEPVAEALHERNRLGYAVVDVIGTLDEIIENAQEVEVDDFLHIAIPIDKWHELQDALEEMPKRAELYTSPISKECEPVGELILDPALLPALKSPLVNWKINLVDLEVGAKFYTSSISKEREPINEVYAFEKWLKENTLIRASLNIDLDYADPLAEIAYRAWKARAKLNTEKG